MNFKEAHDQLHAGINWDSIPEAEVKVIVVQTALDALTIALKDGEQFEMEVVAEARDLICETV